MNFYTGFISIELSDRKKLTASFGLITLTVFNDLDGEVL